MILTPPADVLGHNHAVLADLAAWRDAGHRLDTFAVAGSRTWFDWRIMWAALSLLPVDALQFNGMADGADCLARSYWLERGGLIRPFRANWRALGDRAGHVRNEQMMDHMPRVVLGFLHHEGPSRGTRGALQLANDRNIPTFVLHQTT